MQGQSQFCTFKLKSGYAGLYNLCGRSEHKPFAILFLKTTVFERVLSQSYENEFRSKAF